MSEYIREQSAGDIISNTFKIYINNFRVLFLIIILPVIPLSFIEFLLALILGARSPFLIATDIFQAIIITFVAAPTTVAVSDYCLGNNPGVGRSYKRLTSVIWKFIGTFLLVGLLEFIGFILLVIPGIVLMILLLFAMTLVPLERRGGMDALKRSIELGKGFRWRNFGVLVIVYVIFFVGLMIIGGIWGLLSTIFEPNSPFANYLVNEVGNYIGWILGPIGVIPIVLLYYDMRVRKENYDMAALAQDMMR